MKPTKCVLLILAATALCASATDGNVKLELATVTDHGKYTPKHVLAAWVTDGNTNYVKTLVRYGRKRHKYLATWQQARGSDAGLDGVTGATLGTHNALTVTWDGCGPDKKSLPHGTYLLFVEFTDQHSQGPITVVPFHKGPAPQAKTLPDQPYFNNIKLTYTPEGK